MWRSGQIGVQSSARTYRGIQALFPHGTAGQGTPTRDCKAQPTVNPGLNSGTSVASGTLSAWRKGPPPKKKKTLAFLEPAQVIQSGWHRGYHLGKADETVRLRSEELFSWAG